MREGGCPGAKGCISGSKTGCTALPFPRSGTTLLHSSGQGRAESEVPFTVAAGITCSLESPGPPVKGLLQQDVEMSIFRNLADKGGVCVAKQQTF